MPIEQAACSIILKMAAILSRSMGVTLGGGFGLDVGFIDDFSTEFVITLNYSAIADFHTLQFFSSPQCFP
jgi:hypothetical protein